jgi:leucine dehydrogenase
VLRLARGMTYKCALAGLPAGGGKAVLLDPGPAADREALFRAHGRAIELLGGDYITAEDVGTTPDEMAIVRRETAHVAGLPEGSGDPSPHTARGVFRALQAAARYRWGTDDLTGAVVAVQGYGAVGSHLTGYLRAAGARPVVCDPVRPPVLEGIRTVAPEEIYAVEADIFAPCALGAVLNARTIPLLTAKVVVGGANNQLEIVEDAVRLADRKIVYVPDFLANAGGVITGIGELTGQPAEWAAVRVERLYEVTDEVLRSAAVDGILPVQAAERAAERRLRDGIQ